MERNQRKALQCLVQGWVLGKLVIGLLYIWVDLHDIPVLAFFN